jgi:hypothetical protein
MPLISLRNGAVKFYVRLECAHTKKMEAGSLLLTANLKGVCDPKNREGEAWRPPPLKQCVAFTESPSC